MGKRGVPGSHSRSLWKIKSVHEGSVLHSDCVCVKRQDHTRVRTCIMQYIPWGISFNFCVFFVWLVFFVVCFFSICANQTTELIPAKDKLRHMSHNTASQEKKGKKIGEGNLKKR